MPLFIVPTPIGNLADITFRCVETLKSSDIIACEDTRVFAKLANHYDIHSRLVAYHEHNEKYAAKRLLVELEAGTSVCLVSNAGTPLISDPGYRLLNSAIDAGIEVTALPGPSALITALSVSGLPVHAFSFLGFPPRKPGKLRNFLAPFTDFSGTIIFFEAPHRVQKLLVAAAEVFAPDAPAAVCRELTKLHEEVLRGPLGVLIDQVSQSAMKGECTVLVAPKVRKKA